MDDDVASALRRCAQKSSTATKMKALRELDDALFDTNGEARKSAEALTAIARPWSRAFDRLVGDGDVGCRRDASALSGKLAVACGKSLGRLLKTTPLMGAWVKAMCDPASEVAEVAREGFEKTFTSEERRAMALARAHDAIMSDLIDCLKRRGPQDMVFKDGTETERHARFELSSRAALGAVRFVCERLCTFQGEDSDGAAKKFGALLDELSCFKTQIKGEFSSIRRDAYVTLAVISKKSADNALTPAWRDVLRGQMPKVASTSFALLTSETEPGAIRDMWELILCLITSTPDAWDAIDIEKDFMHALRKHFKRGSYGAAGVSAPSLLPLLAHMPPKSLSSRDAEGAAMGGLVGILDAVFTGWSLLSASAVRSNEARETLPAMREGVLYGVLKLAPTTDHAEECATRVLVDRVVGIWMREFLARGDAMALDLMCDALNILGSKPHAKSAVIEAWAKLSDITEDALNDPEQGEHASAMYARLCTSGKVTAFAEATAPFARAVLEQAKTSPSAQTMQRLADLVESLGVAPFNGAQNLMDLCLRAPAPPNAGAVIAAVLKHEAGLWDTVLGRAMRAGFEDFSSVVVLTDTVRAIKNASSLKCDAMDDIVRRCASQSSLESCSNLLIAVAHAGSIVSASASRDVFESLSSGEREGPGRKALRSWIWPPPTDAEVTTSWSVAIGVMFADVLLESQLNVECVIHEAANESDSEHEVEYVEKHVGETQREWRSIERDTQRIAELSYDARNSLAMAIVQAAAAMARTQHLGESELVFRLWAQISIHALRSFKLSDEVSAKCFVDEITESVDDEVNFYWLDAVAREIGWTSLLAAMHADARITFTIDALSLPSSENKVFTAAICGDKTLRNVTFSSLIDAMVAAPSEDESVEDALLNFLRTLRDVDAAWIDSQYEVVRDFVNTSKPSIDERSRRLKRLLPWLLPSDMSGGEHAGQFISELVRDTIVGVENRRRPLDGTRFELIAACFSRHDDVDGSSVVHSLQDEACAPLMEVYRAIATREAAEAAASAAAARFGGDRSGTSTETRTSNAEAGIAALTAAIIRRTASSFESRDWGAVVGRLDAWTARRVKSAEVYADGDAVDGDDGSRALSDAAMVICLIDSLPMELLEPKDKPSSGDLVPYASHGAAAMTVAKALAHAGWPRERADIIERLYRCVILAGTELHDICEDEDEERRAAFWARCCSETLMWTRVAQLACANAPTNLSALHAGLAVDNHDASCETISALYRLLTASGVTRDDDEATEALRRAAYGMLASKTLMQSAVVGIDASISDVAKVENALDAALAAVDENENASVENFGTPAVSAGLREDLVALLSGEVDAPHTVVLLGWALLLRYILSLSIGSSCRERLVNYTRETKAVATLMRDITQSMPLPESMDIESESDAPLAWRGIDWSDPTSPTQIFDPRLSLEVLIYGATLHALPASVRTFVSDMKPQRDAKLLEAATAATVSPALIADEFRAVSAMTFTSDGSGSLTVKPSVNTREVLTTYEIDESSLQLAVKLPNSYPLAPAELVCAERVGVSEARLRKWMLGISAILKHQNGAVAQGLLQWQRNIDAEFAGVEPCPICYAVLHPVDHQKPRMSCRQCSNTFHATCLYTWFRSSSKSSCPLCVTPWGATYR